MKPKLQSILRPVVAALLACAGAVTTHAQMPIGQWDFDAGTLAATVGDPLAAQGNAGAGTQYGTTTALGIPNIGGQVANVMCFPSNAPTDGYLMSFQAAANGGGNTVNQYTLVMDLLFPASSANQWRSLVETDKRTIDPDADFQINPSGGIGGNGQFHGSISGNTWYRIGFVVDAANNLISKYINGVLVGTQPATSGGVQALDGRWALDPFGEVVLFTDNDGQTARGYVNSIQLRDQALSAGKMLALGGPSAAGIPTNLPPVPSSVNRWIPVGAFGARGGNVGAVIHTGETTIQDSSISVRLDGTLLTGLQITRDGDLITVVKANGAPNDVSVSHTLQISYTDSVAGAKSFSTVFTTVLLYEDFDELVLGPNVNEGRAGEKVWTNSPPAGWTLINTNMPGYGDDATDGVTEWAGWGFANKDWWVAAAGDQTRSQFTKGIGTVAIADPDEWDDAGHTVGLYETFMQTPAISLAGLRANSVFMTLDSSWRPECCDDRPELDNSQTAIISVSFDGGPQQTVLMWDSTPSSPFFHPDSQNESVSLQIRNPAGASSMVISFGLTRSENDWWWAVDNIVVNAGEDPPVITRQPQFTTAFVGDTAILSVTAIGGGRLTYQWFKGAGAERTAIAGATNTTLTFASAAFTDDGVYSVRVSNSSGSVGSEEVRLVVIERLDIPVTSGLVAHLKFDGNATNSVQGNGVIGMPRGEPSYVEGRIGQALRYSSARDGSFFNYVSLGNPDELKFGTAQDFTVAFWTKFTTWTGDPAFLANKNWNSGGNTGWVLATGGDGGFQWNMAPARLDYDGPSRTLTDTNWHHVVVSVDRNGPTATYLDGVLVNITASGGERNLDSDLETNIGQDGTGTYTDNGGVGIADGTMDDVGIWRRAITEPEVKAIFRAALEGKDLSQAVIPPAVGKDLVAYLAFEDNLTDSSTRGNNGTAIGSVSFVGGQVGKGLAYSSKKDGSSFNYVSFGTPADLDFGTAQSFSTAFWAKLNSWEGDPAFLANKDWDSGNNQGWVIATAGDGRIQWNIGGDPAGANGNRRDFDSRGGVFNDNQWHHIAVVYERAPGAGKARTYVDGVRINETTWSGADNQLNSLAGRRTNIGQDGVGDYTDGNSVGVDAVIDEVALWRRTLSDDEVKGLRAAGILGLGVRQASPALTLQLPPGKLTATASTNRSTLRLTWDANAGVRLQRATRLTAPADWANVECTLGMGRYEAPLSPTNTVFYRLCRP